MVTVTRISSLFWKSLVFVSLFLGSVSLLSAQIGGLGRPRTRKEVEDPSARINVGQNLALSQEFSRYGGSSYGFTNIYSTWDIGVALPKSELHVDFSVGGQFSDTGDSPSGKRFTFYKSLFNSFDISYAHAFNRKWSLELSDSLMSYPNLDRYSGYSDFAAATGQVPVLRTPSAFKTMGGSSSAPGSRSMAPLAFGPSYGGSGGYGGYYSGYLGGYGVGTFMNVFDATLTYTIDNRRNLAFTYDNFRDSFGKFGFATQSLTTSYSHQLSPKLTFISSYVVGNYGFSSEEDPGSVENTQIARSGKAALRRLAADIPATPLDPNGRPVVPKTPGLTHTLLAGFSYSFSPDLVVEVSMGPSFTPGDGSGISLATSGSVSFAKTFRDKSQLSLAYSRFVGANFSRLYTGRDSTDELELAYSRQINRRLNGTITVLKYSNPFFGNGMLIGGDVAYQFTRKVTGVYNLTYFPPVKSNAFGSLGSGITNSFTFAYPIHRDLSAFLSYYFTVYGTGEGPIIDETGAQPKKRVYGNSISVGIMHSMPSLIKIGRMR